MVGYYRADEYGGHALATSVILWIRTQIKTHNGNLHLPTTDVSTATQASGLMRRRRTRREFHDARVIISPAWDLEAEILPEMADLTLHVQVHTCLLGPLLLNHKQIPQLELQRRVLCAEKISGIYNMHI